MHKLLVFAPVMLAACATAPAANVPPTPGNQGGSVCRNEGLSAFAGRPVTSEVGAEVLRASGARVIRWVQPGMMVTMDFQEDRVTIWLAAGNRIERVNCG